MRKYTYMRTVHVFEDLEQEQIQVWAPARGFAPVSETYYPTETLSEFQSLVHGKTVRYPRLEILWRREDGE